jgi:sialidase-1
MALLIAVITAASAATQPSTGPACEVVASLGCYVDSAAVRVLPSGMKAPAQPASLETCASLVAAQVGSAAMPDTLLGVEAGKQCWFGPRNASSAGRRRAPASECNLPCAGNHTEICGGAWRMSLFTAHCAAWTLPPPPPPPLRADLSAVFMPGDCDTAGECYPCFRIPALKKLQSGKLIAFAEARGGRSKSCADHGDVKVVARVSADRTGKNGTWGPIHVVANETGHTLGNPSPVIDLGSGRIFCHYARDNSDAFVVQSDDEGGHWTAPRALDATVKVPGSSWYGAGVGGGVEVKGGAGSTLMILSEERLGKAFNSVPVRSTDAGASWQRGSYLNCPTNATHGLGEPSVAIVPGSTGDSHLIMSGRGAAGPPFISFSQSSDSGHTWTPSEPLAAVTSPGCQAPIVGVSALPAAHGGGTGALITSPSGPGRTHLAAYVASKASNFSNWRLLGLLGSGSAGYSSLLRDDSGGSGGGGGGLDEMSEGARSSYLVLWEDLATMSAKPGETAESGMGLWLSRFTLDQAS